MTHFILGLSLTLALHAGTLRAAENESRDSRPNILFCFADDWGWPHAGAYGDPVVKTPAFDRIAEEGVLFQHAFISSPSCTPSRNAIITGQQFYRLGEGANLWSTLDVQHPNFMSLLRDSGYETAHWRKAWGPGNPKPGGYTQHPCGKQMAFSAFMQERDTSKPFCFWFGTSDPHRGYKLGSGEKSGMDVSKVPVPAFYPKADTVRSDIADYYYEVQRWDQDVAKALELLEAKGVLENTIVVMSGDHGMPFPRCKGNLYDWGARVPLAIRWGAHIKPGRTLTDFVSTTDLAPTFLQAAGLPVPKVMTGRSLISLLKTDKEGRVDSTRDHVVYGRERHVVAQEENIAGYPSRAIRTDTYLYIRNYEPARWPAGTPDHEKAHKKNAWLGDCDNGPTKFYLWANRGLDELHQGMYDLSFAKRPAEELYVIADDPDQVNNVAKDKKYAEAKTQLAAQLTRTLKKTADPRETDAEVKFDHYTYPGGVPQRPKSETLDSFRKTGKW